ncbi:hypothetical protein KFL_001960040 [Klebsormidium nitens]|uniref:Uncharacterized protein n=1 Tax=Klebsormidium nitens TaxID=105231 RepID=A0A1Y1I790_KLENI|nr:hypothetical protein KFL_001960040 [Klebsormidium nitens]|eukprot:GAQ84587.1 hypothetical protein KFL_001960040 [Klebsormidium nitens]
MACLAFILLLASLFSVGASASARLDAPPTPPLVRVNSKHFVFELTLSSEDRFRIAGWMALFVSSLLLFFAGTTLALRNYRYKTTKVYHKKAAAAYVAFYAVPVTLGLVGLMNINITEPRQGVVVAAIVAVSLLGKGSLVLQIETWGQLLELLGSSTGHIISTWAAGSGAGHWSGHQGRVPVYAFLVVGLIAELTNFAWAIWALAARFWDLETDRGCKTTLCRALCAGVVQPLPVVLFHTVYHWVYIGLTATAIVDDRGTNRNLLIVAVINMGVIVWFTSHLGGRLLRLLPEWVPAKEDRKMQEARESRAMNRPHDVARKGGRSVEQWLHQRLGRADDGLDIDDVRTLSWTDATWLAREVLPLRAMELFEFDLPPRAGDHLWTRKEWRARVQDALIAYCTEQQKKSKSLEGLYEALLTWCHTAKREKRDVNEMVPPVDRSWRGIVRSGLGHVSRCFGPTCEQRKSSSAATFIPEFIKVFPLWNFRSVGFRTDSQPQTAPARAP